jgi:hypothetical protein
MPNADETKYVPIPINFATTNSRSTANLQPEITSVLPAVQQIFRDLSGNPNYELLITGGQEWGHSLFSRHHSGFAVDLRTKDLPGGAGAGIAQTICTSIQQKLGPAYFVQLEHGSGGPHIHIEFRHGMKVSNPVDTAYTPPFA